MLSHNEHTIVQKRKKKITNVPEYDKMNDFFFFVQQSVSVSRNASLPVGQ